MGYHRAGFEVVGVDIEPQPHYPFEFIQADFFEYVREHGDEFDAIHASPPCQKYSEMQHIHKNKDKHPDLIPETIDVLEKTGKPYVIENVENSPLKTHVMLCGSMFGMRLARHKLFLVNFYVPLLAYPCNHTDKYDPYHGGQDGINEREKLSEIIGINWFMTRPEVRNAIPPAYTEYIGRHPMASLIREIQ